MKKNGYFSTGEFAKLSGVNKSTLFYYDQEGILKPEILEDNGYRYYSAYQFDEMEMIFTFRHIGMPIEEIKEYIRQKSPEAYAEILRHKAKEVEEKAREYERLSKYLQRRMELTEEGLKSKKNSYSVQEHPEEYYYITSNPYGSHGTDTEFYVLESEHMYRCKKDNVISPYPVGEIYTWAERKSDHSVELRCYATRLIEKLDFDRKYLWRKPAGNYLTYYHTDGYPASEQYAERMKAYGKRHKLKLDDYIYEDTLIDETSIKMENSIYNSPYVLKLSIQIIE